MAFAVPAIAVWEPFNCIFYSAWIKGEQDIYLLWPGLWLMQLLILSSVTQSSLTSQGCSAGNMSLCNFFKDRQKVIEKAGEGSGNAGKPLPRCCRVASFQQLSHPFLCCCPWCQQKRCCLLAQQSFLKGHWQVPCADLPAVSWGHLPPWEKARRVDLLPLGVSWAFTFSGKAEQSCLLNRAGLSNHPSLLLMRWSCQGDQVPVPNQQNALLILTPVRHKAQSGQGEQPLLWPTDVPRIFEDNNHTKTA